MISMLENVPSHKIQLSTISLKQIQDELGCSYSTIYRWMRYKRLPHYKVGRKVVFSRDQVLKWLNEHSINNH